MVAESGNGVPMMADGLDAAIARLGDAGELLVALDFDGTLAPFADDPAKAGALPGSWAAVLTLERARRTRVVLVSGRPLAGLVAVSHAPESMALVGSHGVEWRVAGADAATVSDVERDRVQRLAAALDGVVAGVPGARIERKPVGLGVHTRGVDPPVALVVEAEARRVASEVDPHLVVRGGKDILEFAVRDATKGDAIVRLRAALGADAVFFAGDDVTDEDAFRVLGSDDVGVKVGDGATAAPFRVADPVALTGVLQQLARVRAMRRS